MPRNSRPVLFSVFSSFALQFSSVGRALFIHLDNRTATSSAAHRHHHHFRVWYFSRTHATHVRGPRVGVVVEVEVDTRSQAKQAGKKQGTLHQSWAEIDRSIPFHTNLLPRRLALAHHYSVPRRAPRRRMLRPSSPQVNSSEFRLLLLRSLSLSLGIRQTLVGGNPHSFCHLP